VDIGRNGDEIDIPDGPAGAPPTDVAAPGRATQDRATQDRATPDRDAPVSGTPDEPSPQGADDARAAAGFPPSAERSAAGPAGDPRTRLAGVIALYTLERLGLTAVLAFVLSYFMPVLVALAFAVVLQMPLAFVLFRRTRDRMSAALAVTNARRRSDRDQLRAALAGEDDTSSR
jgi:hypothetical protein